MAVDKGEFVLTSRSGEGWGNYVADIVSFVVTEDRISIEFAGRDRDGHRFKGSCVSRRTQNKLMGTGGFEYEPFTGESVEASFAGSINEAADFYCIDGLWADEDGESDVSCEINKS